MAKKRKYLDNGPDGDPVILPVDKNGIPVAKLNEVEVSSTKLPLKYSDENVNRYAQAVASGQIKLTQIPDQKLRNTVRAQPILSQWNKHMNKNALTASMLSIGIPATIIGASYLKGPMDVLASPASSIAKVLGERGIISTSGYASNIARGADILYNTALSEQGIENLLSNNGVQKTIAKIKEGDTLGAVKSGAIDVLDLLGGIGLIGNARNFFNNGKFLSRIKFPRRTKKLANNGQTPKELPVRHLDSPEITSQQNNIPVNETISRTQDNVPSRNNTNEIGTYEAGQPVQHTERNVSGQQPQKVVHTLETLEENVENRGTLENLLKAKDEHSEAIDAYNLWFDNPTTQDEKLKHFRNIKDKQRELQTIQEDYVYNLIKDVDFSKPLESQIDFDKIPNFALNDVLTKLQYTLDIISSSIEDSQYRYITNELNNISSRYKFDPSGYAYAGRRNHPNLIKGETIFDIKKKLKFYLDEAENPRYFGQHTEKFDKQFSLQSKPMITGAITALSKQRRKNGQLPVRVSWLGKGRSEGNSYSDLLVDGVRVSGTDSANGPVDVNIVLRQNIKRDLDFYEEFHDQLGIPKEKIEELKKAFEDGTMSLEDFGKIQTEDGHYMFTVFDKQNKVGRYPSIRADFKNGGSLNNRRSLKNNGGIYIKPSHRGRFTALKERTGHSATWFKENGTPAQKKMATFALNAAKWKH